MDTRAPRPDRRRRPRKAASRGGPDQVWLKERLETLRRETQGDDPAFRLAAVDLFRTVLDGGRAEAQKTLEEGGSGRSCAERLSDLEDQLIRALHDMARRLVHPGLEASARLTIIAVGGDGRG